MCRWCITGTPLNRGLDDLYGLFYFLHANPYSERHFWKHVLQDPYMAGCPAGTQAFACVTPCEHMQRSALLIYRRKHSAAQYRHVCAAR